MSKAGRQEGGAESYRECGAESHLERGAESHRERGAESHRERGAESHLERGAESHEKRSPGARLERSRPASAVEKPPVNIYVSGVGGQGVGVLADLLARICLDAGHYVYGCDTHGLAQRHGLVVSHVRLNQDPCTPRIAPGEAHLVMALERLEAYRAARTMLAPKGEVFYYDAVYQPLAVRLGEAAYPKREQVEAAAAARGGRVCRVADPDLADPGLADPRLADPRLQNVALLAYLVFEKAIPGVTVGRVREVLAATLPPSLLDANLEVFERVIERAGRD